MQSAKDILSAADARSAEKMFLETCTKLATGPNAFRLWVGNLSSADRDRLERSFENIGIEVSDYNPRNPLPPNTWDLYRY